MPNEEGGMIFEVEKVLNKEVRNGKVYYLLKWARHGQCKRIKSWEPEENLNCDYLITEYEKSRALVISGVAKRNRDLVYLVRLRDPNEIRCVKSEEARIWPMLLIEFLMEKIKYEGFVLNDTDNVPVNFLKDVPVGLDPSEIVYATDILGETNFGLRYPNGIFFASATEVKEKWADLLIQYLERNLEF